MDDMRSFEHHIAGELGRMAGPEPPVDALAVARSVAAQAPKRRFQTMFSALKFVAAGVVLAMFSGFLFVSLQQSPNQPAVVGASPSAVISAEPTVEGTADPVTAEPTASEDTSGEPLAFTRSIFESDAKFSQSGIAALPTGEILVVGGRNTRSHGWLSTDGGETWARNSLGMSNDEEHQASDVIEWNGGFVVVGTIFGGPFESGYVVTSADGETWTDPIVLKRAQFFRVQATRGGLLIRGNEVEGRNTGRSAATYHPAVFISTDGLSWETHRVETAYVPGPDEQPGQLFTIGAARSESGIWLVPGGHQRGGIEGFIEVKDPNESDQSEVKGLLWRSDDDGVSWAPLDLPISLQPGEAIFPGAIAWTPSGFVLALGSPGQTGSMWHSEDGLSWVQVADTGEVWVASFAVDGQRVVAFTRPGLVLDGDVPAWADDPTPVFQSRDGRSWTQSLEADFDRDVVDRATVSSDGRIVAIGRDVEPLKSLVEEGRLVSYPTLIWVGDPS